MVVTLVWMEVVPSREVVVRTIVFPMHLAGGSKIMMVPVLERSVH